MTAPPKIRWAQRQRLVFIGARLAVAGRVNRADLMAEFEISPAQCAVDFRLFRALFPDVMTYDESAKSYVLTPEPTK